MSLREPVHWDIPKYHPDNHYCASCNKKTAPNNAPLLRCSACRATYYCEKACQKRDYAYHKLLCQQIPAFISSNPRGNDTDHLALKFPVEASLSQPCPKLIWWSDVYKPVWQDNEDLFPGIPKESFEFALRWLRNRFPRAEKYVLDHELFVAFRPKFLFDGSKKNLAIEKFFKSAPSHDWRGDMYIMPVAGMDRSTHANVRFQDFRAADLRVLADFFKFYGKITTPEEIRKSHAAIFSINPYFGPGPETRQAGTVNNAFEEYKGNENVVKGVNITSGGDQKHLKKAPFVKHRLCASSHPIFRDTEPTPMSIYMGLPLLVRKHGFFKQGWPDSRSDSHLNREAVFLNRPADPLDEDFGYPNLVEWDKIIGTVLVVRQDRKAITPQQVEAFCLFCREYWAEHIEETLEAYEREDDEDEDAHRAKIAHAKGTFIKNRINREKFEEFFEEMKAEKIQGGDTTWVDATSPYSV